MRTLSLLTSLLSVACIVSAAQSPSPDVFVPRLPFVKRADSNTPGHHKLQFVLGNGLFETLVRKMSPVVPSAINGLRIPDMHGAAPSNKRFSLTSSPKYNFTHVGVKETTINDETVIRFGNGVIDFVVDMNVNVVADYMLSARVVGFKKAYHGKADIQIEHAIVRGNLTVDRNDSGGISVKVDHIESEIKKLVPSMPDHPGWIEWIKGFLNLVGRPVFSTALGAIVSTSVPTLVSNTLLANMATRSLTMADGRKVEAHMEVVDKPVITPEGITVNMDLRTAVRG